MQSMLEYEKENASNNCHQKSEAAMKLVINLLKIYLFCKLICLKLQCLLKIYSFCKLMCLTCTKINLEFISFDFLRSFPKKTYDPTYIARPLCVYMKHLFNAL